MERRRTDRHSYDADAAPPALDGAEDVTSHVRPLASPDRRYQRYSHAIRDVARPKLFENRPSWRLVDAEFSGGRGKLTFGDMNYFDAIDICEAPAHETAAVHLVNDGQVTAPTWRGQRLRKEIGDPSSSAAAPSSSSSTRSPFGNKTGVSMVLHSRSAESVATAGGCHRCDAGRCHPALQRAGR